MKCSLKNASFFRGHVHFRGVICWYPQDISKSHENLATIHGAWKDVAYVAVCSCNPGANVAGFIHAGHALFLVHFFWFCIPQTNKHNRWTRDNRKIIRHICKLKCYISEDTHHFFAYLSNDKDLGWLGYIGDYKLPSYIGIIINHYKDPY